MMAALKPKRVELFAQYVAAGKPMLEAGVLAGYRPDKSNLTKRFKRPDFQARVRELEAAAGPAAEVDADPWLQEIDGAIEDARRADAHSARATLIGLKMKATGQGDPAARLRQVERVSLGTVLDNLGRLRPDCADLFAALKERTGMAGFSDGGGRPLWRDGRRGEKVV
jgi:hypothetical protein